jgi:hypothetical protein
MKDARKRRHRSHAHAQMAREPLRGRHWQQKSACTPSASVLGALQFSEEFSLPGVSPDSHW